jgi:hypothetical protein
MNNNTPRKSTAVITPADLDKRIEAKRAALAEAKAAHAVALAESRAASHDLAMSDPVDNAFSMSRANSAGSTVFKANALVKRRAYALATLEDALDSARRTAAAAVKPDPVTEAAAAVKVARTALRRLDKGADLETQRAATVALHRAEAALDAAKYAALSARCAADTAPAEAKPAAPVITAETLLAEISALSGQSLDFFMSRAGRARACLRDNPSLRSQATRSLAATLEAMRANLAARVADAACQRLIQALETEADAAACVAHPTPQAEAAPLSGVDLQCLVNEEWNARCEVQSTAHRAKAAARDMGEGSAGHLYCLEEAAAAVKRADDLRARLAAARLRLA